MPVKKIFSNQQALRKKIDDLNGILKTMEQQKTELQTVLRIVEGWSKDLQRVERTNLGVPYIRCVKEILGKIVNRPFAASDHVVQNPPCWRASSFLFPHWDIKTNASQASLVRVSLF